MNEWEIAKLSWETLKACPQTVDHSWPCFHFFYLVAPFRLDCVGRDASLHQPLPHVDEPRLGIAPAYNELQNKSCASFIRSTLTTFITFRVL